MNPSRNWTVKPTTDMISSTDHESDATLFMHPTQARIIRESFAQIEPCATIAALIFYQRLFALDPSLRALFQHDIEQQGEKLMQALRFAVASIENPRELQPVLESLGRRHVHYGVKEAHYETVGTALIGTIANLLGPAFTPEVKEAWLAIYTFMADTMKRAAAKAPQIPPGATAPDQQRTIGQPQ